jgi:heme-degrading monooxygenase HmoA
MFNRLLTFQGATDLDGGVTYLREAALPVLEAQHGYRGVTASGDRASGIFGILSVWDTESDRSASDSALGKAREEALKIVGGELTVENFEEVVLEMVRPASPGYGLFVTRVHMNPSVLEENLEFFRGEVLPQIKSQSGFCSLRSMVDRATGRGIVGSVWETRAQAETMQATAPERRARAEERGVSFDATEVRDVLFASFR